MIFKDKIGLSFLAFENQLETDTHSHIHEMRLGAFKQFEKQGFPTIKNEYWKYTSLRKYLKEDYQLLHEKAPAVDYKQVKNYFLHQTECYSLVFINGVFSSFLSETTHDGMDICILSAALEKEKYMAVVEEYFNKLIKDEQGLCQLNTAFAREGAYIKIPKNKVVEKPIQILNFNTQTTPQWRQPRNLIVIEENAEAQIIERHQSLVDSKIFTNSVSEIYLDKNARLNYYKIQDDRAATSQIDHSMILQQSNSTATVNTFSFGGQLLRNNLSFSQQGSGCESNLNGISILKGKQHADNNTIIGHNAPDCTSNEMYRGIYEEQSTGVFNGRVWVHQEAQRINAFQQNDNILVGDKATVNTKPQLEIFADDVKCSHGCTIGQLDESALFYMQQRGIPKESAKSLLMYAFAGGAVQDIKISELKNNVHQRIAHLLKLDIGFTL